jgi:hypothetical protein
MTFSGDDVQFGLMKYYYWVGENGKLNCHSLNPRTISILSLMRQMTKNDYDSQFKGYGNPVYTLEVDTGLGLP